MASKLESATLFAANARLNDAEYALQRLYLQSMPRHLTITLGNGCNIDCLHCFQVKNGDHLLRDPEIGRELRKEFSGLYPYLSTVRFMGGEVFALRGFRELVEDIEATVDRPVISVSTNGTLIDDDWAQRIVGIPFQAITVSLDGATPQTYEKLRRGARLETVLQNIKRIQSLRQELASPLPRMSACFVVMRSNYREIPQFLDLIQSLAIEEVAIQTLVTDGRNLTREPGLAKEVIASLSDVRKLHVLLKRVAESRTPGSPRLLWSGLKCLFEQHGLDPAFLDEERCSLYPVRDLRNTCIPDISPSPETVRGLKEEIQLCPNPWTELLIAENGDVSLCCVAQPIGNIFEAPLIGIWNNPKAITQRSEMIAGRYRAGGCSSRVCAWREGKSSLMLDSEGWRRSLREFKGIVHNLQNNRPEPVEPGIPGRLDAVRRLLQARENRIRELEGTLADLWEKNGYLHDAGQAHIAHLERTISGRIVRSALRMEKFWTRSKSRLRVHLG